MEVSIYQSTLSPYLLTWSALPPPHFFLLYLQPLKLLSVTAFLWWKIPPKLLSFEFGTFSLFWPWTWMLKLSLKPNTLRGRGVQRMKESGPLLRVCQLISSRSGSLLPCAAEITAERDFDGTWVIVVVVDLPDVYWLGLFSPEAPCSLWYDDCLDWLCSLLWGLFLCSLPHTKSTDSHRHERLAIFECLPVVLAP